MALIRKQYATPVLADEMNKIISEELSAYIQKEKLDILGNPIPETSTEASGDWESPENFTFAYEIGLAPSIDLNFGRGAKFVRHIIKVDKKAIEAACDGPHATTRCHQRTRNRCRHGFAHWVISPNSMRVANLLEGGIESDSNIALEHLEHRRTRKQSRREQKWAIRLSWTHTKSHMAMTIWAKCSASPTSKCTT